MKKCLTVLLVFIAAGCGSSDKTIPAFRGVWVIDGVKKTVLADQERFKVIEEGAEGNIITVYDGENLYELTPHPGGNPEQKSEKRRSESLVFQRFWHKLPAIKSLMMPQVDSLTEIGTGETVVGRQTTAYKTCYMGQCPTIMVDKDTGLELKWFGGGINAECTELSFESINGSEFQRPW